MTDVQGVPSSGYSPVQRVDGPLLLLAGQPPLDAEGRLVGLGDAATQTEQVFSNIARELLSHGARLPDLVRITIYVADRRHVAAVRAVRARILSPPLPTATIVVAGLLDPNWFVEIEAIAAIPPRRTVGEPITRARIRARRASYLSRSPTNLGGLPVHYRPDDGHGRRFGRNIERLPLHVAGRWRWVLERSLKHAASDSLPRTRRTRGPSL